MKHVKMRWQINMSIPFLLSILAAVCVIPILIAGAYSDIKTRTFPKAYWKYIGIPGVFVALQYLVMSSIIYSYCIRGNPQAGEGLFWDVIILLGISLVTMGFCMFMGLRYGSGGDWRALMYIGIISPAFFVTTGVLSLIFGAGIAVWVLGMVPKGTDWKTVDVPFSVAICAGYVSAVVIAVVAIA